MEKTTSGLAEYASQTQNEEVSVTETYTTPQMFGATGDGVTDDTAAVQSAINSGMPVVMDKKYAVTDIYMGEGTALRIDGELSVSGKINVNCPNVEISGNGTIRSTGAVCFELAGDTTGKWCKNFRIQNCVKVIGNEGNTAFLITAKENGNANFVGVVVYPEINCIIQNFQYGIHSTFSGSNQSWFTALRCNALIESCQYAVVLDWMGDGSIIEAVIQPKRSDNPGTDTTPLVRVRNSCIVRGFCWDLSTAPNSTAVEVVGKNNRIDIPSAQGKIRCYNLRNNVIEANHACVFPFSGAFFAGSSSLVPSQNPYDNTNDFARNAGNNKVALAVTPSSKLAAIRNFLAGKSVVSYISDEVLTMEFTFPEALALRNVAVAGQSLPNSVAIEYKNAAGEWVLLKTCERGIDYTNTNGNENYAWWQFVYADGMMYGSRFAHGVRITLNNSSLQEYTLSRIYIGAVEINAVQKTGDDIVATSFRLKGTDGKFYKVTIQNGQLSATEET